MWSFGMILVVIIVLHRMLIINGVICVKVDTSYQLRDRLVTHHDYGLVSLNTCFG
jgi:hypothetical protein